MFYVYILFSYKDHQLYIGFTQDLDRRLKEHNAGNSVSTKGRRPLELIFYEAHRIKADAMRRERYFKTTKGKSTIHQMLRECLNQLGYQSKFTRRNQQG